MNNQKILERLTEIMGKFSSLEDKNMLSGLANMHLALIQLHNDIAAGKCDVDEKSEHQQSVEQFMRNAGQSVPTVATVPSPEVRLARAKLILEECLETINGLGVGVFCDFIYGGYEITPKDEYIAFDIDGRTPNLQEIIDGCCDIKVVATGTLSACGIPDAFVQRLVDENNLAKFGPGGYKDEHGKWRKPPGHQPPDIAGYLDQLEKARAK